MIAVIDYGAGNLQSVRNALDCIGCPNTVAAGTEEMISADGVILPGVGAFASAMSEINKRGLASAIRNLVAIGKPLLGICAGMQLFFETSEESPGTAGLGILPGKVLRLPQQAGLKVPHMGWNSIKKCKESRLLGQTPDGTHMYFVHSFYVRAQRREDVAALSEYGIEFDAAVERDSVFGCQFHPEKSGAAGLSILKRFTEIAGGVI